MRPVFLKLPGGTVLPFDKSVTDMFAAINWTELNAAAKRDYAKLENLDIEIKRASKCSLSRSTEKE